MQRKSNAMKQSMKQSNTREQVELENPQGGNKSDIGPTMSGDILVAALEREAVDTIFAYPGGAGMELHQALTRSIKSASSFPGTSRAVPLPPRATREHPENRVSAWQPVGLVRPTWSRVLPMHSWIPFH